MIACIGVGPGSLDHLTRRGAELLGAAEVVAGFGAVVALVLAWDLTRALDPSLPDRLRFLEALRDAREVDALRHASPQVEDELREAAGRYRDVGQVYQDTVTGKMSVVEPR